MFLRDLHRTRGGGPDMARPCVQQGAAPLLALSPDSFLLLPDARKFRDEKGANIRLPYAGSFSASAFRPAPRRRREP